MFSLTKSIKKNHLQKVCFCLDLNSETNPLELSLGLSSVKFRRLSESEGVEKNKSEDNN